MDTDHLSPREKVAETVLAYYRLADTLPATARELAGWVDKLPVLEKAKLLVIGLQQAIVLPAFKRYVLEARGYSMRAYMQAHLSPTELRYWVDDNDGGVRSAN